MIQHLTHRFIGSRLCSKQY